MLFLDSRVKGLLAFYSRMTLKVSMTEKPPFYITTPIYYVNDSPHIGHAYTTIACDVMARFMRLDGHEVKFLTGTDEHGQKVDKAAKAAGKDPQSFTDEVSQRFRNLVDGGDNILNVTNDDFIRTTEERHKKAAQALWQRIEKSGNIYKDTYGGWYAVRDEAYYQESELVEKDGKKVAPTGAEVEWVEEESYFFKLSAFQDRLLQFYEKHPDFIIPKSRYNEIVSFVKGGLKDLSISRTTFNWGVEVPPPSVTPAQAGVQEKEDLDSGLRRNDKKEVGIGHNRPPNDGHIMYVWIDALANYLTGVKFPDTKEGSMFRKYWGEIGEEIGNCIHVVGKDIIRFHAVYWPAFLMAADLPMPKRIVAHGWWTIEGEKMSKSLGNVLSPQDMIAEAGGVDQLRYYMMRAMPFGNDGDFSHERLKEIINADLANNIGNLAQRTLSMIQKNCDGKVPNIHTYDGTTGVLNTDETYSRVAGAIEELELHESVQLILDMATKLNIFIDTMSPWTLKKIDPIKMEWVLYTLAEGIRHIAILLQPFCPIAANKLLDQLAVPEDQRKFEHLTEKYALKPGTPLPPPQGVFPRLDTASKEEKTA